MNDVSKVQNHQDLKETLHFHPEEEEATERSCPDVLIGCARVAWWTSLRFGGRSNSQMEVAWTMLCGVCKRHR
eukprot:11066841-Prorocentrum_lima.AAC.1